MDSKTEFIEKIKNRLTIVYYLIIANEAESERLSKASTIARRCYREPEPEPAAIAKCAAIDAALLKIFFEGLQLEEEEMKLYNAISTVF